MPAGRRPAASRPAGHRPACRAPPPCAASALVDPAGSRSSAWVRSTCRRGRAAERRPAGRTAPRVDGAVGRGRGREQTGVLRRADAVHRSRRAGRRSSRAARGPAGRIARPAGPGTGGARAPGAGRSRPTVAAGRPPRRVGRRPSSTPPRRPHRQHRSHGWSAGADLVPSQHRQQGGLQPVPVGGGQPDQPRRGPARPASAVQRRPSSADTSSTSSSTSVIGGGTAAGGAGGGSSSPASVTATGGDRPVPVPLRQRRRPVPQVRRRVFGGHRERRSAISAARSGCCRASWSSQDSCARTSALSGRVEHRPGGVQQGLQLHRVTRVAQRPLRRRGDRPRPVGEQPQVRARPRRHLVGGRVQQVVQGEERAQRGRPVAAQQPAEDAVAAGPPGRAAPPPPARPARAGRPPAGHDSSNVIGVPTPSTSNSRGSSASRNGSARSRSSSGTGCCCPGGRCHQHRVRHSRRRTRPRSAASPSPPAAARPMKCQPRHGSLRRSRSASRSARSASQVHARAAGPWRPPARVGVPQHDRPPAEQRRRLRRGGQRADRRHRQGGRLLPPPPVVAPPPDVGDQLVAERPPGRLVQPVSAPTGRRATSPRIRDSKKSVTPPPPPAPPPSTRPGRACTGPRWPRCSRPPRAGAGVRPVRQPADPVDLVAAAYGGALARPGATAPRLDQRPRPDQARVVPLGPAGVVRHARGGSRPPRPRRSRPGRRCRAGPARPGPGPPGRPAAVGQRVDVDRRVPGEQRGDQVGVVGDLVGGERGQRARPRRRTRGTARATGSATAAARPVSSSQVLGTGGEPAAHRSARTPAGCARAAAAPRSAASRPAPARQTAPGAGPRGQPQRTARPAPPRAPTGRRPPGSRRRNAAASAAGISARGSNAAASTCTSAKPRSQRPGSGTFFSTTAPSIVETVRSSGADRQVQRVDAADPGQRLAQRRVDVDVGGAVLDDRRRRSRPAATSSRAYTPQQPENDSKRSRSRLPVTTGSRLAGLTGWW